MAFLVRKGPLGIRATELQTPFPFTALKKFQSFGLKFVNKFAAKIVRKLRFSDKFRQMRNKFHPK